MCEEYVCALEVSMNNLDVVQSLQTPRSLYEDFPEIGQTMEFLRLTVFAALV
jgi:hypothetical protein